MVRLSSPISSRLILAGSHAILGGLGVYGIFWLLYGESYMIEASSSLYRAPNENPLQGFIDFANALGPVFAILAFSAPFIPFTFVYASVVCPSRITITDTEIRAKFFTGEKRWPTSELKAVTFQTAGENQFIIFKVAGKTLKAEIEHGRWGAIRDLLPPQIAQTVAAENTPQPRTQPQESYPAIRTLSYLSEDEFEQDYRAEIYEQANKLAGEYDWWMEPLWLYDQLSHPHKLTGQSQLFRPNPADADSTPILGKEINSRDNALMSLVDAQRIVALLQILSQQHEITWTLYENYGADELGRIAKGAIEPQIDQRLDALRKSCGFSEKELQDEALQSSIRQKNTEERRTSDNTPDAVDLPIQIRT